MKLATFLPSGAGGPLAGEVRDDAVVAFDDGTTVLDRLASGNRAPAGGSRYALADVELLAPVARPRAIFGIGLNYAAHARETGGDLPERPIVFLKLPSSAAAPGADVHRPAVVRRLDYEGELAVVLGPERTVAGYAVANDVSAPAVVKRLDYEGELAVVMGAGGEIAGYAVADDLSARDLQKREPQWTRAKGFDGSCPFGPWVTTADEVAQPGDLALRTWVNGELRQDSRTSDLIFSIPELVAFLRETITLEPGDLILTGTPSGVGQYMDPPQFLASGDVVRIEIEALGVIEHAVA